MIKSCHRRLASKLLFSVIAALSLSACIAFIPAGSSSWIAADPPHVTIGRFDVITVPCSLATTPRGTRADLRSSNAGIRMSLTDDGDGDGNGDGIPSVERDVRAISYGPFSSPFLAVVDLLSFLAFAAVGKASHSPDGSLDLAAVFATAFPFLIGWYLAAPLMGCYDPQETARDVGSAVKVAAKGWVVAVPLGCVFRGIIKGYVPPVPFVVVTMISTLVILSVARAGYSKAQTSISEFLG